MDVEFNAINMLLLYTPKETHVQQTPHTDYKLVAATREDIQKEPKLAWTLHLPLTVPGSWITLWNGHRYGTHAHIGNPKSKACQSIQVCCQSNNTLIASF